MGATRGYIKENVKILLPSFCILVQFLDVINFIYPYNSLEGIPCTTKYYSFFRTCDVKGNDSKMKEPEKSGECNPTRMPPISQS